MSWKDVAEVVAKHAPAIGGAIGGPVGAIAGAAASLLAQALGVESSPEAVLSALKDPALVLKLREIEASERAKFLEFESVQLQAQVRNLESARSREVELAKAGHGAAWGTSIVAVLVTVGFFVMLGVVLWSRSEGVQSEAALLLLGTLAAGFGAVINYYLGSSVGSKQKDGLLAGSMPPVPAGPMANGESRIIPGDQIPVTTVRRPK